MVDAHTPSSMSPPVADRESPMSVSASDLTRLNSESYSSSNTVDASEGDLPLMPSHHCFQLDAVNCDSLSFVFAVSWKYDFEFFLGMNEFFADCALFFCFERSAWSSCDLVFVLSKLISLIMSDSFSLGGAFRNF